MNLAAIQQFCEDVPILRLSLFGSVLRDDFTPISDVDLLVEYLPEAGITLLDMARQESQLTRLLEREVDLRTPQELSPYFRQEVLDRAVVIYERN
ncbi:MAG: nucleotidyltransferase domain-containing protein [Anaerolineae bacterium]|nr:nucleotidyltransferase domain-containing protein [Anaerolineae bacterium]